MIEKILDPILEQLIQGIASAIYSRSEFRGLHEAIEKVLNTDNFKQFTRSAFNTFASKRINDLPEFFDEGFITHIDVQVELTAYIVNDEPIHLEKLAKMYSKRLLKPHTLVDIQIELKQYLQQLRETFYTHPEYGSVLLARDISSMQAALDNTNITLNTVDTTTKQTAEGIKELSKNVQQLQKVADEILIRVEEKSVLFTQITSDYKAKLYVSATSVLNEQVPNMKKLIGRETIYTEIFNRLENNGRVLIQGFGGDGKTALAATLASDWLKRNKGAVLWLRAGSANVSALAEACAASFKLQEHIVKQPEDTTKLSVLYQILEQSPVKLLILDDCWVPTVVMTLINRGGIPGSIAVLVTSRQQIALRDKFRLDALSFDSATELLKTHIDISANDDTTLHTLYKLLYGSPFALEIAGITMRENSWNATRMLEKITEAKLTLALPDEAGEDGRENIAAIIAASRVALPDAARNVFDAWGAFFANMITPLLMTYYFVHVPKQFKIRVGTELRDIAPNMQYAMRTSFIQGVKSDNIESELMNLQKFGLATYVNDNVPYFRLHDLAYEYVKSYATNEMQQRSLNACLYYIERYRKPSKDNLAALRPELLQFMGASEFAMSTKRYFDVNAIAMELYGVNQLLDLEGYYSEALKLFTLSLQASKFSNNKNIERADYSNLGSIYAKLGYHSKAIEHYELGLKIAQDMGDKKSIGIMLTRLGISYLYTNQFEKAISCQQQAIMISKENNDIGLETAALANLANVYMRLQQYEKAIGCFNQALPSSRAIHDKRGEAGILMNLSNLYMKLGQYQQGIESTELAISILSQTNDRVSESRALGNLGMLLLLRNDLQRSEELINKSIDILKNSGDKLTLCIQLNNIAQVYHQSGQFRKAFERHSEALIISQQLDNHNLETECLNGLGVALVSEKNYSMAINYYHQALKISLETKNRNQEVKIRGNLGIAYLLAEDYGNAIEYSEQAILMGKEIHFPQLEIFLDALAKAHKYLYNFNKSLEYYSYSIEIAREGKNIQREGELIDNMGATYQHMGDYAKAIECYSQALVINKQIKNGAGEAINLNNLGIAYENQKNYDLALDFFQKAKSLNIALGLVSSLENVEQNIARIEQKKANAE